MSALGRARSVCSSRCPLDYPQVSPAHNDKRLSILLEGPACLSLRAQSTVGFANGLLSLRAQSTAGFANGLSPMSSNLNPASIAEISSWTTPILLAKRGPTLKGLYERFDLSLALDDPARGVYNRAGAARLARDDYIYALMRFQQQHLQLHPAQDAAAAAAAAAAAGAAATAAAAVAAPQPFAIYSFAQYLAAAGALWITVVITAVGFLGSNPIYSIRPVDSVANEGVITGVSHAQLRLNEIVDRWEFGVKMGVRADWEFGNLGVHHK